MQQHTTAVAIPLAVDEPTVSMWPVAGRSLGMGRSATYDAHANGRFPVPVIEAGGKLRVPTAALRRLLQLDCATEGSGAAAGS